MTKNSNSKRVNPSLKIQLNTCEKFDKILTTVKTRRLYGLQGGYIMDPAEDWKQKE